MTFNFLTDDDSQRLCEDIVRAIEYLYDVPADDALQLVQDRWAGEDLRSPEFGGTNPYYYVIHHETADDWAGRLANSRPPESGASEDYWKQRNAEAERRLAKILWYGVPQWPWESKVS